MFRVSKQHGKFRLGSDKSVEPVGTSSFQEKDGQYILTGLTYCTKSLELCGLGVNNNGFTLFLMKVQFEVAVDCSAVANLRVAKIRTAV